MRALSLAGLFASDYSARCAIRSVQDIEKLLVGDEPAPADFLPTFGDRGTFAAARRHTGISLVDVGAQRLADQLGARPVLSSADFLDFGDHGWREGDRERVGRTHTGTRKCYLVILTVHRTGLLASCQTVEPAGNGGQGATASVVFTATLAP
jgi:hypothetical protein